MRIAIYQADIAWENPKENRHKVEQILQQISGKCDILVLAEMFTTGFTMTPERVCERMDGDSVKFLVEKSTQYSIAIMGSVVIEENSKFYNRLLFAKPASQIEFYDKRHLFRMSGEDKRFSSGNERKIFRYMGFNILPQICYDLRFPVWSRNCNNEYDIAIYVASWPVPRIAVWDTLLRARALENQCYVVGVNRIGTDPVIDYNGKSTIIDFLGNSMASVDDNREGYVICELSKDKLDLFRQKFPAYLDADNFKIEL